MRLMHAILSFLLHLAVIALCLPVAVIDFAVSRVRRLRYRAWERKHVIRSKR